MLGEDAHDGFDDLDLGDWVGVEGTVMVTRKGELSVKVDRFELLAKALRPLPDKWKGLTDIDTRYRQRYTDLIVNEEARRVFEIRHAVVTSFRTHAWPTTASSRSRRRSSTSRPAAPTPAPSSPTTTPSTSTCTCASRSSCT